MANAKKPAPKKSKPAAKAKPAGKTPKAKPAGKTAKAKPAGKTAKAKPARKPTKAKPAATPAKAKPAATKASAAPKLGAATSSPAKPPKPASGNGTADSPWQLTTPPGSSAFIAYRDEAADPPALVCKVGSTTLSYQLRCLDDLHAMLKAHGDWMPLGGADEQKPAPDGSVEAWGRADSNPVGGWYGIKKGFRGRFGVYVPPVMEVLGLAEVEHEARNNRMRAK